MAIRVGTTAHDQGGIRASSSEFEAFTGLVITSIAPDPIRPGDVVTITMPDTTLVHAVLFAGVAQTFAAPTGTTVTFTAPDGFFYGNRAIRVEEISGAGREVLHPYAPVLGNQFVTLAGFPPGLNFYGDQILHVAEAISPQPVDGAQLEVVNPAPQLDFVLHANASYSVLANSAVSVRAIYSDQSTSVWSTTTVLESGSVGAPRNLRVESVGPTSVRLRWDPPL